MANVLAWVAHSGVVQGIVIGATLAFLTAIVVLNTVIRAITTTVNGWSSIRKCGQPGNGILVRAACAKALPVVNVFGPSGAGGHPASRARSPAACARRPDSASAPPAPGSAPAH